MTIADLIKKYRRAKNKLILLDYDGTLVNYTPVPKEATPDERLLGIIAKLNMKQGNRVIVITGRESTSIDSFLGHLPIEIIAEHGAASKTGNAWESRIENDLNWITGVRDVFEKYVLSCPGSFIENKKYSITWHYRLCDENGGWTKSRELIKELSKTTGKDDLKIIDGNKVVEVTMAGVSKGAAAIQLINQKKYDFVLAIGDDKTDEEMFGALVGFENCYTIKVGAGETLAKHKLVNVPEVLLFLEQLTEEQ
jgi:trehalose 6-phosphate synthase/phosphatase